MIETVFFDLDETLVKSDEATARLFEDITRVFEINISGEGFRRIFREQALSEMKLLSQYNYIEKLNIGSYDLFYINLENSILERFEIEQYRIKVCQNTINRLDYYNENLTAQYLILYLRENWIKYYKVFEGVHDVLKNLNTQYKLVVVTNGFDEIQKLKISFCDLTEYFEMILVSSQFGIGKPEEEFYSYVLNKTNSIPEKSIMVGDNLKNDILGANNIGLKTIFINRNDKKNLVDLGYISDCHSACKIKSIAGIINQWESIS